MGQKLKYKLSEKKKIGNQEIGKTNMLPLILKNHGWIKCLRIMNNECLEREEKK